MPPFFCCSSVFRIPFLTQNDEQTQSQENSAHCHHNPILGAKSFSTKLRNNSSRKGGETERERDRQSEKVRKGQTDEERKREGDKQMDEERVEEEGMNRRIERVRMKRKRETKRGKKEKDRKQSNMRTLRNGGMSNPAHLMQGILVVLVKGEDIVRGHAVNSGTPKILIERRGIDDKHEHSQVARLRLSAGETQASKVAAP